MLVKDAVTDIIINDYGFEWFEDGADGCTRISSQYKDDPYISPPPTQFVQYDLITSKRTAEISAWSEVDGNSGL